ncbi:MAG: THUMP domain-containing class I SAM-dependent RNA methyltransferase [Gemmatirosa sp.]
MRPHAAFAVAAPGFAPLVADELRAIGLRPTAVEDAGVAFAAHDTGIWSANLRLRTASRVLVRLGQFRATDFRELERQARALPWETFLTADVTPRLRVTCRKSRLYHSDAVGGRVADAIAHRVGGRGGFATAADDESDVEGADGAETDGGDDDLAPMVVVRFLHDECTVSVDSSGALLHRRGYRQAVGRAPLRETLAAAMLLAAGYDGSMPFLDPLCGSGTLAIEAALIARDMAPGRHRRFVFERWPNFDAARWATLLADADARVRPRAASTIEGSDRDAGAIAAAVANAERAGVAGDVRFVQRALSSIAVSDEQVGLVAANPPYGKRVGESSALRDLWARLGDVLRVVCPGWRVALLGPDPALERQLRLPLTPALRTTNGGIPVRVLTGTVPDEAPAVG